MFELLLFLLLLLLCLNYPGRVSAFLVSLLHPSLSCTACLQLTTPIFLMSFSSSSSSSSLHPALGLLLHRLCSKLPSCIFVAFLASSIRSRCPIYPRRCLLKPPILTSLYNSPSSFVRILRYHVTRSQNCP